MYVNITDTLNSVNEVYSVTCIFCDVIADITLKARKWKIVLIMVTN